MDMSSFQVNDSDSYILLFGWIVFDTGAAHIYGFHVVLKGVLNRLCNKESMIKSPWTWQLNERLMKYTKSW
jgi:hypothetical protein